MGKTYKKVVRNKFEKKKFNNLKKKQFKGEYEDESILEELEELQEVREENNARKQV
jgi:hypothetical protein